MMELNASKCHPRSRNACQTTVWNEIFGEKMSNLVRSMTTRLNATIVVQGGPEWLFGRAWHQEKSWHETMNHR
jgi:hypothetical protein